MSSVSIRLLVTASRDFERQTLGWLLLDPTAWDERLRLDLFFDHAHREVFQAIWRIRDRGEPRSEVGVFSELRSHAKPTAREWGAIIAGLLDGAAFRGHEDFAVTMLAGFARRWAAIKKHESICELLADPTFDINTFTEQTGVSGLVPDERLATNLT